jgi:hypothetical protein
MVSMVMDIELRPGRHKRGQRSRQKEVNGQKFYANSILDATFASADRPKRRFSGEPGFILCRRSFSPVNFSYTLVKPLGNQVIGSHA